MAHHLEVLEHGACLHIIALQSFRQSGDYCLTLASETTSMDPDVNIQETSVSGKCQRQEHSVSLRWVVEIVDDVLPIDGDHSLARLQADLS
jgi:hypothetical protein